MAGLFGRRLSARTSKRRFAEHVDAMAEKAQTKTMPTPLPVNVRPVMGTPVPPEAAEVEAPRLMNRIGSLPTEPPELMFEGWHRFVVLVAYDVDPYRLAQEHGRVQLEARMALETSQPTCYWCGQAWSMQIGQRRCPGTER